MTCGLYVSILITVPFSGEQNEVQKLLLSPFPFAQPPSKSRQLIPQPIRVTGRFTGARRRQWTYDFERFLAGYVFWLTPRLLFFQGIFTAVCCLGFGRSSRSARRRRFMYRPAPSCGREGGKSLYDLSLPTSSFFNGRLAGRQVCLQLQMLFGPYFCLIRGLHEQRISLLCGRECNTQEWGRHTRTKPDGLDDIRGFRNRHGQQY